MQHRPPFTPRFSSPQTLQRCGPVFFVVVVVAVVVVAAAVVVAVFLVLVFFVVVFFAVVFFAVAFAAVVAVAAVVVVVAVFSVLVVFVVVFVALALGPINSRPRTKNAEQWNTEAKIETVPHFSLCFPAYLLLPTVPR